MLGFLSSSNSYSTTSSKILVLKSGFRRRELIIVRRRLKSGSLGGCWSSISGAFVSLGSVCISNSSSKRSRLVLSAGRQCVPADTSTNTIKMCIFKSSMGYWFSLFLYRIYIATLVQSSSDITYKYYVMQIIRFGNSNVIL